MVLSYIKNNPALMRLYKNAGILFAGNTSGAVINFFALAILTRGLGLETFALFALLTAYISLIDRLVSFQAWQALIHFGSKAIHENAQSRLSSLLLFGWLLDLFSSFLGFILAVLGLLFIPQVFGLDGISATVFYTAASVLAVNWVATPTAILRLFDKFIYQAIYSNISALLRFSSYLLLWINDVDALLPFVLVWSSSLIISRLYLFVTGVFIGKRNKLFQKGHFNLRQMIQETPRLWHFVLTTNLDGVVRVVRDLDIFVVNALLGTTSTGLYKIAREIARIPSQFTAPFYQAIYPDLSRLITNNKFYEFITLMRQSSITLGSIMICGLLGYAVLGGWFIETIFGQEYTGAYTVTFWCLGSTVIWAFAQPLSPAMLSLGKVQAMLIIHAITTALYLAILHFAIDTFNLTGAGFGLFLFYALWATSILILFIKYMKTITNEHQAPY